MQAPLPTPNLDQSSSGAPRRLAHYTSPAAALAIARTLAFRGGPIYADNGLNAHLVEHPAGPYLSGLFSGRGAVVTFQWQGEVTTSKDFTRPNALYDQHPFRAFIPAGTSEGLQLVGIDLEPGATWCDTEDATGLRRFDPRRWLAPSKKAKAVRETNIADEVRRIVASAPAIKVVSGLY